MIVGQRPFPRFVAALVLAILLLTCGAHVHAQPTPHAMEAVERPRGDAAHERSAEQDIIRFMIAIVVILLAAKLGGEVFERIGQPAVLGELLLGIVIGNLSLIGITSLGYLQADIPLAVAAELGAVFLLFEVGLESRIEELLSVGVSSFLAAAAGVIVPMMLGWGVGAVMLPEQHPLVHVFLGATLAATSVGITARVLKDLGKMRTREARIILGAAVIDDVLGLVVLAVVVGLIKSASDASGGVSAPMVLWIVAKAALFLLGSLVLGRNLARPFMNAVSHMKVKGGLLAAAITICFGFSAVAGMIGLAPIVGAFAAGLVLEPSHWERFTRRGEASVEQRIAPIGELFVPVFFVLMGLRVDLRSLADVSALGLAAALTGAALIGKLVCGLAVVERGLNRLVISVGMVPRGEVGLIFASIGALLVLNGDRVVNDGSYSAVLMMVMITTFIAPVWLKLLYSTPRPAHVEPSL